MQYLVVAAAAAVVVVKVEDAVLELLVGDPEANVPGHEPCKWCTESFVEGFKSFIAASFDGAGERSTVPALGAVHESENVQKYSCWNKTSCYYQIQVENYNIEKSHIIQVCGYLAITVILQLESTM